MNMPQEFFSYGDIKLGYGSYDLPPIMIGTMFYQNQTIVDRKNEETFDEEKAVKRIDTQKALANKFKIPDLIEISAISPEAMVKYLEFYFDKFEPPFVLGGTFEARVAGLEWLSEKGVKPNEFIYNAVSNLKNKKEIELLQKNKITSAVVLILASSNMTSTQRYSYITENNQPGNTNIIDGLKKIGIQNIWVDGGVVDIESLAHILETQQLISTSLRLPVGTAPTLFLFKYSSPRLNKKFYTKYRKASIIAISSLFSNFLFYGAIEDAKECFASVYQALEFKNVLKNNKIKLLDKL